MFSSSLNIHLFPTKPKEPAIVPSAYFEKVTKTIQLIAKTAEQKPSPSTWLDKIIQLSKAFPSVNDLLNSQVNDLIYEDLKPIFYTIKRSLRDDKKFISQWVDTLEKQLQEILKDIQELFGVLNLHYDKHNPFMLKLSYIKKHINKDLLAKLNYLRAYDPPPLRLGSIQQG